MKKIFLVPLIPFLFFPALIPVISSAADYYVAKNGNDSNPGTEEKPWLSIQKAANILRPGDTVFIKQGIYKEKVIPRRSGKEGYYITFRNYKSDMVIIDAEKGSRDACIYVNDKKYLQFIGFRLTGASGDYASGLKAGFYASDRSENLLLDNITSDGNRFGILLHGNHDPVSRVTIKNCTITGNTGHGIFVYKKVYEASVGPNNRVFANCGEKYVFGIEIGTDYPGNQVEGAKHIVIHNSEIHNNGIQGIRTWNAMNILIRNNHLHRNGATGIQIENGSKNIVIQDNISEYNAQREEYEAGIWIDSAENVLVQRNIARGNKIGLMVTDSRRVILRHNVILENNRGVPNLYNSMGVNIDSNTYDVAFVQNTLYKNGAAESSRGGLSICAYHRPVGRIILKNNIISKTGAPYDLWVGEKNFISNYNLFHNPKGLIVYWLKGKVDWHHYLKLSGQDANSIAQKDPKYLSPEKNQFNLQPGSPAIDAGDFLTQTSASGSGTIIPVADEKYFTNGFGMVLGDRIKVGTNPPVKVIAVDASKKNITVDKNISWIKGEGVSYPYSGSGPDMGAYEFVSEQR